MGLAIVVASGIDASISATPVPAFLFTSSQKLMMASVLAIFVLGMARISYFARELLYARSLRKELSRK